MNVVRIRFNINWKPFVRAMAVMLVIAAIVLGTGVAHAALQTLYEHISSGGDGSSGNISANNWAAMQFTTGNVSHTVTSIRVPLKRNGTPSTVTVSLREAVSGNATGADLMAGTIDGDLISTDYAWYEFDVPEVNLESDHQYAIIVRAIAGDASNNVQWAWDSGGFLADAVASVSTDGSVTWTPQAPADFLFEIWGYECIEVHDAKVFNDYIEDGDWLVTLEYKNIYPPYYDEGYDPATLFDVQLVGSDNTTVIATNPCQAWGNKPASVYISAADAVGLQLGGAYNIRLYGDFGAMPSANYTLLAGDWMGTDDTRLDSWVILTAHRMETYYDTTFVESVANRGEVLNEEGGVIFLNGIPALSDVRPDLFLLSTHRIEYEEQTWTNAFQESVTWETRVGSTVASMLTNTGILFNMTGNDFGGMLIFLVYLALAVLMVGKGHTTAGIGLAAPFILLGAWLGLVPIIIVGVASAVCILLFVWSFWWTRT